MLTFKCKKCGKLQYSSCLSNKPCIYCGGEVEVESVERLEDNENATQRTIAV